MADMLIAEESAVVVTTNQRGTKIRQTIKQGKLYRSDHPLVRGREHLFSVVETTTAAPGERRSIPSRPRKTKAESKSETTESEAKTAPAEKPSE